MAKEYPSASHARGFRLDLFRDFLITWSSRLRSSLFTFVLGSLLVANWKIIFFLFASDDPASVRIRFANLSFDYYQNLVYPLAAGIILSIAFPWLTIIVEYFISKPIKWSRTLQESIRHSIELVRVKNAIEEETRKESLLKIREFSVIERARADEEARKFGVEDELAQAREESELDSFNSKYAISGSRIDKADLDSYDFAVIEFLGRENSARTLAEIQASKDIGERIRSTATIITAPRIAVMIEASVLKLYRGKILLKANTGHYTLSKYGYQLFDQLVG